MLDNCENKPRKSIRTDYVLKFVLGILCWKLFDGLLTMFDLSPKLITFIDVCVLISIFVVISFRIIRKLRIRLINAHKRLKSLISEIEGQKHSDILSVDNDVDSIQTNENIVDPQSILRFIDDQL